MRPSSELRNPVFRKRTSTAQSKLDTPPREHHELEQLIRENQRLKERLARLSEASVRINESLELENVLQGVLDSARSLTGAHYGILSLFNGPDDAPELISSGLTNEQAGYLLEIPGGVRILEFVRGLSEPVRFNDAVSDLSSLGVPDFVPPMPVNGPIPFVFAPIIHHGTHVGGIHIAGKDKGSEFGPEDEEILAMFAAQAAMVIVNARRHLDEMRAKVSLETLIETSPIGVCVFNARTGELTSFNRETARIAASIGPPDVPIEQLPAMLTMVRGDGTQLSLSQLSLSQRMSDPETIHGEVVDLLVEGGDRLSALVNVSPVRSPDGVAESLVITVQDMAPLDDLERQRTEFMGMVSHELRAPLTSIKGSVATLIGSRPHLDNVEMDLFFEIIDRQADQMSTMITELLDMARIENGTLLVSPEPSDVASILDGAKNAFLSVGSHNVQIDMDPDLPRVLADRRRISQVLGNLLLNAARHSTSTTVIQLAAAQDGMHVAISVVGQGEGISSDEMRRLFRKYPRIGGEPKHATSGAGIGLVICKGIVDAHGGRIWAESEGLGQGSRFVFTLPAVGGPANLVPESPTPGSVSRSLDGRDKIRVLVVDDDPQTLRFLRESLSDAGYAPIVTGDPERVSQIMQDEQPGVVLLDLLLPGIDGIDLMDKVQELREVPVIFISAYGRDETIARALEAGAEDYIVKPFSPTELFARLQTALRRRNAREEIEPSGMYHKGDLTIDFVRRRVFMTDRQLILTDLEYRFLAELAARPDQVLSHDFLLRRVWGQSHVGNTGRLRTVIKNLRRKLGENAGNPKYIFNEPRVGYRIAEPDPEPPVEESVD